MYLIFIIGVLTGSFLAVIAKRVPLNNYHISSRSQCETCQATLKLIDLIPFYNLLFHQNKCRYCKKRIPIYHSFFEIITAFIFLLFYEHFSFTIDTIYLLILWLMALTLSLTDLFYYLVEPKILYPFSLLAGSFYFFTHSLQLNLLIAPIFLSLIFLLLTIIVPNSIGGGDIKLLIIWSFFLSSHQVLWLIFIASLLGILFIILMNVIARKQINKLPFVPFLSIGLVVVTLFIK
ncbi:prepilin peptidase [Vagococcus carniphilus]|uniref:prepilin peptidase n=1 Tax=Vagococcus carniphilus TaxID=218144 RepID=UPI00288CDA68|nr:prepilin peptidase [Vagococcus carniphilus]MDT2815615.1 prepilin peptidase [Vagococcus carniphilus]